MKELVLILCTAAEFLAGFCFMRIVDWFLAEQEKENEKEP